ncbi:hypothetical protein [Rosistilla oblonga]|uniref:hypothetical protein n=1 Tax=Rosistilla oblonga TaxID=2527990 RepID=UPI003A97D58D
MRGLKLAYGIAIAAVFFLLLSPRTSEAAPACGDPAKVMQGLESKYHEVPVAEGVTPNGQRIVVLVSPVGQTFTILLQIPNGPACLVTSGEAWQELEIKFKGPGA